jgi:hypothetical protein
VNRLWEGGEQTMETVITKRKDKSGKGASPAEPK